MTTTLTTGPVTRLRDKAGLSMAAVARASGASYTSLSRCESGLAVRVPPAVLAALASLCGAGPDEVQADYATWRESLREAA
jgi:transcriptional regulator with XRE-family HTH domain